MAIRKPTKQELYDMWDSIGIETGDDDYNREYFDGYLQPLMVEGLEGAVYHVTGDEPEMNRLKAALSIVEKWYENPESDAKEKHENTYRYVVSKLKRAIERPKEL